ncbi:hypothetical protein [Haloferax sulfurifontis]|nr:hypothetical protein [Haloferax sulfurifontis]
MAATTPTRIPMVVPFVSVQQYDVRGFVLNGLKGVVFPSLGPRNRA